MVKRSSQSRRASSTAASGTRRSLTVWAGRVVVVVIPVYVWQLAADRGVIDTFAYSRPNDIAAQIGTWLNDGTILSNVWTTLLNALAGYAVGSLIGTALAALFVVVPRLGEVYTPVMTVANALPGFALTPLLIAAFGFGVGSSISLVTIVIMFVSFFAVLGGLQSVGSEYTSWARCLGGSELQLWRTVRLPAIVGWLIASLRISVGLAFSAAIVAEFVGGGRGIGFLVSRSMNLFDATSVFAGIVVILLVVILIDNGVRMIERRATRWIGFA
jgi:NitT/TauT family transport system permease protein